MVCCCFRMIRDKKRCWWCLCSDRTTCLPFFQQHRKPSLASCAFPFLINKLFAYLMNHGSDTGHKLPPTLSLRLFPRILSNFQILLCTIGWHVTIGPSFPWQNRLFINFELFHLFFELIYNCDIVIIIASIIVIVIVIVIMIMIVFVLVIMVIYDYDCDTNS